jgi:hypothetical protein
VTGAPRIPDRPFARLRWALPRVAAILEEDGYATDELLAAELALTRGEVQTVISVGYRQRRLDRVDGYVVLPARPRLGRVA